MFSLLGLGGSKARVDTTQLETLIKPLIQNGTRDVISKLPAPFYEKVHAYFFHLDQAQLQLLGQKLCNGVEQFERYQLIYELACKYAKQKKELEELVQTQHGPKDPEKLRLQAVATKLDPLLQILKPILMTEISLIDKLPEPLFIKLHTDYFSKFNVQDFQDLYTIACGDLAPKRSKLEKVLLSSKQKAEAKASSLSVPSHVPVLSQSIEFQQAPQLLMVSAPSLVSVHVPSQPLAQPHVEHEDMHQDEHAVVEQLVVLSVVEAQPEHHQPSVLSVSSDVSSGLSSSLNIQPNVIESPVPIHVSASQLAHERSLAQAAIQSSIEARAQLDNAIEIINGIISSAESVLSEVSPRITAASAASKLGEGSIHIAQAKIQLANLKQLQELMEVQRSEMPSPEELIQIGSSSDQQSSPSVSLSVSSLGESQLQTYKSIQFAAANIRHASMLAQAPVQFIRAEILDAKARFNEARELQRQDDERSLVANALSSLNKSLTQINAKVTEIEQNLEKAKVTYASTCKAVVAPSASLSLNTAQEKLNQLSSILANLKNAQELININHATAKEAEVIFIANSQVSVVLTEEQRAENLRTSGLAIRFAAQNGESILPMVQSLIENAGSALSQFNSHIQNANLLQEQYTNLARDLAERLKLQQAALETSKPTVVLPEVEQLTQQYGTPLLAAMAIMQFAASAPQLAQQISNKHKDLVATHYYGI